MDPEIQEQLRELTCRVASLEEQMFRTHRVKRCVHDVISKWPGPFTVDQISQAISEFHPAVSAGLKPYAVACKIRQLEREGIVVRATDGAGCLGAVYERVREIPEVNGRPGPKFNRRAAYESGFRHIVRTALGDLPKEFTLADLRAWMAKQMPAAQIPYGSWSSTLYKLQKQEELICIKGRGTNCSCERKVWTRGPKHVAPSGDEVRELEAAWAEFRKTMTTERSGK